MTRNPTSREQGVARALLGLIGVAAAALVVAILRRGVPLLLRGEPLQPGCSVFDGLSVGLSVAIIAAASGTIVWALVAWLYWALSNPTEAGRRS